MSANFDLKATLSVIDKGFMSGLRQARQAVDGLKGVNDTFRSVSQQGSSMFKSMLGARLVGDAITGLVSTASRGLMSLGSEMNSSAKAWKTFDGNLSNLGFGKDEIKSAKDAMKDYAATTVYSASDMASTYAQLAAVGVKDTGQLVKAFGGLAGAAENPAQAMKTLSQQATQMAAKPKVAWEDFKLMMQQTPAGIAAVAKEMGMSTEEMVAAVQDGRIATDDFFEALKRAGNSDAFQKMATEFKTVDQAIDGMREGLANKLEPAFNVLNATGLRALQAIGIEMDKLNFDALAAKMEGFFSKLDIEGVISKVSTALQNGYNNVKQFVSGFANTGAIDAAKSALQSVWEAIKNVISSLSSGDMTSLGETVGNAFAKIAEGVDKVAQYIAKLPPGTVQALVTAFLGFQAVGPILTLVSGGLTALSLAFTAVKTAMLISSSTMAVIAALKGIAGGSAAASSALTFMAAESKLAAFALKGLSIASSIGGWFSSSITLMGGLTVPIWGIVAAAVGLIATLVALYHSNEEFRNMVTVAWDTIKENINAAIIAIISFVKSLWGQLTAWWSENQALFTNVTSTAWNAIQSVIMTVINALAPIISAGWDLIVTVVQTAWELIKVVIETALNVVLGIIKAVMQLINGDWSGAWETLKGVVGTAWEGIKSFVQVALTGLGQIIQAGLELLKTIWETIWNTILAVVTPIWEAITSAVSTAMTVVGEWIQTGLTTIQTTWEAVWNAISTFVTTVWTAISNAVMTFLQPIATFIEMTLNTIKAVWELTWNSIKAFFAALLLAIVGLVTGDFEMVKQAISNAWNIIKSNTEMVWNIIKNYLQSAWNLIKTTVSNAMENVKTTVSNAWNAIKSAISSAIDNIKSAVQNGWNNVKSAVSNAVDNIKSTVTNGWNNVVSAVTNAGPRIVSAVRSGFDNAVSAARNFVSQAASVGSDLIAGFVNGVTAAAGQLVSAVSSAVGNAISAAKGLLGIKSPSRIFRQFGLYTDEGFVIGINTGAGKVVKSMANMAQGAISAFTGQNVAGSLMGELGDVDGELGRLTAYDPSVSFNGGHLTVGQQAANIVLTLGGTAYRAFTNNITEAQELELVLDHY